jgi:peroxiredoxin
LVFFGNFCSKPSQSLKIPAQNRQKVKNFIKKSLLKIHLFSDEGQIQDPKRQQNLKIVAN